MTLIRSPHLEDSGGDSCVRVAFLMFVSFAVLFLILLSQKFLHKVLESVSR